ncbi:class I SAM-dependent methyltransferase [Trichlorobacter ammonificans]|uniref:Methyltransferase domain-containing protein n=1 Tax=Trichlorobacter ammonificans TaxID=2916410 RepID=A0ABN8HL07_9BACT|nr:methyltransferase domain-containing protein [Trichlorobacter ammonificans]CAH2032040.1 protein of unknown function [Trichlorobacter ammonificans]
MRALLRFLRGYRCCRRMLATVDPVLRHDYSHLSNRIVEREPYLLELARGRRVLHFGFLDSIFLERKLAEGSLLHSRLGQVAHRVCGVDIEAALLERYRELTGDQDNLLWDIADTTVPEGLREGFDLVLFPEVLEHVPNPGLVLSNLATLCRLNRARLCLTLPNAFDMYGFMAAMQGVELVHPDHLYTFTPRTLTRLVQASGLRLSELCFYNFGSDLAPGLTKAGMIALCEPVEG